MKKLVVLLFGVFSVTISAQENCRTSDFNLHPKTETVERTEYVFNPDTKTNEVVSVTTMTFYNTYLQTVYKDYGSSQLKSTYHYNIDNLLVEIREEDLTAQTENKILYQYKKGQLVKKKEFISGRLFSETNYTYDKTGTLQKAVEKEIGNANVLETLYSNYTAAGTYKVVTTDYSGTKIVQQQTEQYTDGLLQSGIYEMYGLKTNTAFLYDEKRNLISEQNANETPTVYRYEYDAMGNPVSLVIANATDNFRDKEIRIKNTYSDFRN